MYCNFSKVINQIYCFLVTGHIQTLFLEQNVAEYYLYQIFSGPRGTWYPTFHNSNTLTLALRGISVLFVYYFPTMQFNQSGSSLTDPQKFALTPGF